MQHRIRPGAPAKSALAHSNLAPLAVFVALVAVYVINPDPYWSGDLNSNSVFAFNVLEFRTIWLDAFAHSDLFKAHSTYSFSQVVAGHFGAGHWIPGYPVGAAILTFPFYAIFYAWFWLIGQPVGITSAGFEPYRLTFSHICAGTLSAATVTLFFLIARRQFSTRTVLISTACLAFATMQWGLLTQTVLQHGPSSFTVIASAYLLLRADDAQRGRATALLLAAGLLAGFLFMIRPTNLVFMAALMTFAVLRFRVRSIVFAVGLAVTFGICIAWNWTFFHSWIGPAATDGHSFNLSVQTFVSGFLGLAISPVRGLIPNSPFLLFVEAGVVAAIVTLWRALRRWDFRAANPDILLMGMLLGACAVLYLAYCLSPFWEGGVYGSRYLSETMPFVCYFLNFSPTVQGRAPARRKGVFIACVAIGVLHQVTAIVGGAKGSSFWNSIPYGDLDLPEDRRWAYLQEAPLRSLGTRVWNIRDGLVERIWRGFYANRFEMSPAIANATNYAARCKATVVSVVDNEGLPVDRFRLPSVDGARPYLERLWEMFSAGRKFVHVRVRNDGDVPLHSYRSGVQWGFATMLHKVINEDGKTVYENGTVYVSEIIRPGEIGDALGSMELTTQKGRYRVEARMGINGIGYCGPARHLGTVEVE